MYDSTTTRHNLKNFSSERLLDITVVEGVLGHETKQGAADAALLFDALYGRVQFVWRQL